MGAEHLASYRRCVERIRQSWPRFLEQRRLRLSEQARHGRAPEKVAEGILEDFFTQVLDWSLADLNHQLKYADLVLSRLGVKYLLVEVKRPGSPAWNRHAVELALEQARRYASEQKIRCLAVSDGGMLYAADLHSGGLTDRVLVSLATSEPPEALWWLSVHGIYRRPEGVTVRWVAEPATGATGGTDPARAVQGLLHPRYKLPAFCFAYAGDASDWRTWKLPYLLADGTVDAKRLPKAIQAILSNYRGTKVSGIPECAVAEVLVRLARAAVAAGKLASGASQAAPVYRRLVEVIEQLGRSEELFAGESRRRDP